MFDEYGSAGRPRRSAGKSHKGLNVETLVVADKKMVEKHGKANVTTYILTVMNMVREIVRTPTPCLSKIAKNHGIPSHGLNSRCSHMTLLKKIKFGGNWLHTYMYLVKSKHTCLYICLISPGSFGNFPILFLSLLFDFNLFQQVSSLFKDGTIGSDINIVVVSLILLEQEPVSAKPHLLHHSSCHSEYTYRTPTMCQPMSLSLEVQTGKFQITLKESTI